MENQEIKTALQEKRHPIFVALERGLNASAKANIQPASDRVTNIGYYFFWGAVFGCNCRNKIRINVGGFEDSPAGCGFPKN